MADDNTTKPKRKLIASTAMWTAGILLAVNVGLLCWKPLAAVDPEALPAAHTWTWWATKEYNELKKAPDVVLLGSSMLMHPTARVDADLLNHDLNYVEHHRSNYIEQALQRAGFPADTVYNFALPGGMVSDDYLVMRALMNDRRRPKVAVVVVSMRDFMDCQVRCVGATQPFKFLARYTNIDDLLDIAMPQIWQRFDYLTQKGLYLWGKKLDMQVLLSEGVKSSLGPIYKKAFAPSRLAEADPTKNLPMNLRSEVEFFPVRSHEPITWNDNSSEYRKRYKHANHKLFKTEALFMTKLVDLARQKNIQLMIVNTPLTPENHALMPPGAYDHFRAYLHDFAKTNGIALVDLDGRPQFTHTDYYDSAHMNGFGGKKMADAIVQCLTSQPYLIAALRGDSPATKQIAGCAIPNRQVSR